MTRRTTLGAVAGVLATAALAAARNRSGTVPDRRHVATIGRPFAPEQGGCVRSVLAP
ncbi:hypothetical protein ACWFNE_11880 [Cellulomonas sp. NPDC055163]